MSTDSGQQRYRCVRAYCRVSSEDQAEHGTSLDGQREEILRYCAERGWQEPLFYVEVESGGESNRENRVQLSRVVEDAAAGDVVLTYVVDRWARDAAYTLDTVRKIVRKGAVWIATHDATEITSDDCRGMGSLIQKAADSEIEKNKIKERTVGTRRRLRRKGLFVEGNAPMGYTIVKRRLEVDPTKAPVVRRMFDLCIDGASLGVMARTLRDEFPGVRGIDPTAVMRRIRDRRYLGELNTVGSRGYRKPTGVWIKTHDPIVDQGTWDAAQRALTERRMNGRPAGAESRTAKFLCRGLITCPKCGHHVYSWSPEHGASTKHGGYYHCPEKCVRARHDRVDAHVEALALAHLESLAHRLAKPAEVARKKPNRSAERDKLIRKRERVVAAIADEIITRDDARAQMAEIATKLAALEAPEPAAKVDHAARLREVSELRRAWAELGVTERRTVLKSLVVRIELVGTSAKKWQRNAWAIRVDWKE